MNKYIGAGMITLFGSGGLFWNYLSRDSISFHLLKKGKKLINDSDKKGWDIRVAEYKEQSNKGFIYIIDNNKNIEKSELQNFCNNNKHNTFINNEDSVYLKVEKFCTEPDRLEDKLKKERKEFIKNSDNEEWTKKTTEYKDRWFRIDDIYINTKENNPVLKNDITENKMKIWCDNQKIEYSRDYDSRKLNSVIRWCTK